MIAPKKNEKVFTVVDCETFDIVSRGESYPRAICNVGIVVMNRKGEIYHEEEIFISLVVNLPLKPRQGNLPRAYIERAFYKRSVGVEMVANENATILRNFKKAWSRFDTIVSFYRDSNPCEIWSYNASFDYGAFYDNCQFSGFTIPEWYTENWHDLWRYTACLLLARPSFVQFAQKNNLYAKSGVNLSTTAETAYKYIKDDVGFIEAHTGLKDAKIESEILVYCLRQRKKASSSLQGTNPWRIVKDYVEK